MTDEQRKKLINTARPWCFTKNAVVPKWALKLFKPDRSTLDFGCGLGDHAHQIVREWRKAGNYFAICCYDLRSGYPFDFDPFQGQKFEQVYASNVLQIQPTADLLAFTCKQIADYTAPGGLLLWNWPKPGRGSGNQALTIASYVQRFLTQFGFVDHDCVDKKNQVFLSMKGDK